MRNSGQFACRGKEGGLLIKREKEERDVWGETGDSRTSGKRKTGRAYQKEDRMS